MLWGQVCSAGYADKSVVFTGNGTCFREVPEGGVEHGPADANKDYDRVTCQLQ